MSGQWVGKWMERDTHIQEPVLDEDELRHMFVRLQNGWHEGSAGKARKNQMCQLWGPKKSVYDFFTRFGYAD